LQVLREGVKWSLLDDKAVRWDLELRQMQEEDQVPPEAAGRMFGKLSFGAQRVFNRCGRAALRPFLWRQHSFTKRMTKRLASAIRWWRGLLSLRPSRLLHAWQSEPGKVDAVLYTDAECHGKIGVVCAIRRAGCCLFARSRVPGRIRRRLQSRATQINVYELLGVLCTLLTFEDQIRGKKIAVFIDNKAALDIVVKGCSRADDANEVVFTIWETVAALGVDVQWLWVASKSNLADGPSRDHLDELRDLGAEEVAAIWPAFVGW